MLFAVDFSLKEAFYIPWTTAAQMALESMLAGVWGPAHRPAGQALTNMRNSLRALTNIINSLRALTNIKNSLWALTNIINSLRH